MRGDIWKDATSYSRGERGTVEPRTWEAKHGDLRVIVTKHRHYPDGEWVMHCRALDIDTAPLGVMDLEWAKAGALGTVKAQATHILESVEALLRGKEADHG